MRRGLMITMTTAALAVALACTNPAGATTARPTAPAPGWTLQAIPNPPGSSAAHLYAVSCSTATDCTAVGDVVDSVNEPLAEVWNGSTWTQQAVPAASQTLDTTLYGVSCASSSSCVAVGTIESSPLGGYSQLFAETWDGSSWAISQPVLPPGVRSSQFESVSCASATSCIAVGSLMTSSGTTQTLAEIWTGGSGWAPQATPSPSAFSSYLAGVSCRRVNRCTAVGAWRPPNQHHDFAPLAERWNGTKWTLQHASAWSVSGHLFSVSCASATSCMATGGTGGDATLADYWNGTTWTLQSPPAVSGQFDDLYGVSCNDPTSCTAVGFATTADQNDLSQAAHWNGTAWSSQPVASPGSGKDLSGVSCASAGHCTAVGYFLRIGSQVVQPLAEQRGS